MYLRGLQLFLSQAGDTLGFQYSSAVRNAHFVSMLQDGVLLADNLKALQSLPPSTEHLPHEQQHPDFAFADNVGRSVVAKIEKFRLFVTMQWRHNTPLVERGKSTEFAHVEPNGICRFHLSEEDESVDRLATVGCDFDKKDGLVGVHSLVFGRFAIGMNSNLYSPKTWIVPKSFVGLQGADLISGKHIGSLPLEMKLLANQTLVFFSDGGQEVLLI